MLIALAASAAAFSRGKPQYLRGSSEHNWYSVVADSSLPKLPRCGAPKFAGEALWSYRVLLNGKALFLSSKSFIVF